VGPKFILDCSATSVDVEEHLYSATSAMILMVVNRQKKKMLNVLSIYPQLAFQNESVMLLKLFRFSPIITETCLDGTSMPWSLSSLTAKGNGS
jgi:hypothetical protein